MYEYIDTEGMVLKPFFSFTEARHFQDTPVRDRLRQFSFAHIPALRCLVTSMHVFVLARLDNFRGVIQRKNLLPGVGYTGE